MEVVFDMVSLINLGVITMENLDGFSDGLKEKVEFFSVESGNMAKKLTEKVLVKKLESLSRACGGYARCD